MIIKMKVDFCSVDYIDKEGVKHCTLYVNDGGETRRFPSTKVVPMGSLCDFKLDTLVDMRQDQNGRYRPGQNHGRTIVVFDKVSVG